MISRKKLNQKLDLILAQQQMIMSLLVRVNCTEPTRKRLARDWDGLWEKVLNEEIKWH